MKVLAIGAHPDDIEILCAGTLARCKARGDSIAMAVATNGEVGSMTLGPAEIAAVRRREAEAAAAVLGAEFYWLDFPDEFLFEDRPARLAFIELLRKAAPDIVITHAPQDYHADHQATGSLAANARMMVTVPNIATGSPPLKKIPEFYYMDTVAGVNFEPALYVDITGTMDVKRKMLAAHESQSSWLKAQYGISYIEFAEIAARFRGLQAGVEYAEAFRPMRAWPAGSSGNALP